MKAQERERDDEHEINSHQWIKSGNLFAKDTAISKHHSHPIINHDVLYLKVLIALLRGLNYFYQLSPWMSASSSMKKGVNWSFKGSTGYFNILFNQREVLYKRKHKNKMKWKIIRNLKMFKVKGWLFGETQEFIFIFLC